MTKNENYAVELLTSSIERLVIQRVASLDHIEIQKRKGINRSESEMAKHYARADRLLLKIEALEQAVEIIEFHFQPNSSDY
jgi:hypothetical protein